MGYWLRSSTCLLGLGLQNIRQAAAAEVKAIRMTLVDLDVLLLQDCGLQDLYLFDLKMQDHDTYPMADPNSKQGGLVARTRPK